MEIIKRIIQSLEGNDGKLSGRKTTAFWMVFLATLNAWAIEVIIYLMIYRVVNITDVSVKAVYILITLEEILCAMVLLLFGIITIQQIMGFKFFGSSDDSTKGGAA